MKMVFDMYHKSGKGGHIFGHVVDNDKGCILAETDDGEQFMIILEGREITLNKREYSILTQLMFQRAMAKLGDKDYEEEKEIILKQGENYHG